MRPLAGIHSITCYVAAGPASGCRTSGTGPGPQWPYFMIIGDGKQDGPKKTYIRIFPK